MVDRLGPQAENTVKFMNLIIECKELNSITDMEFGAAILSFANMIIQDMPKQLQIDTTVYFLTKDEDKHAPV